MVEDEYGRDPAIRYKRISLLAFPRTTLSKLIEDGELPHVVELFDGRTRSLEELVGRRTSPNAQLATTASSFKMEMFG